MNLKAVVFDLDGTLADTIPLTVFSLKEVTRELTGKELSDEDILAEFGPIDTEIIRKLVDNDMSERSVDVYIQNFTDNFNRFVKPIDGIEKLLKYLKEYGFRIGLFTGRSRLACHIVLEKLGIRQYFDEIFAGDDTSNPKPDPEGILKTFEKLNIPGGECAYVGDCDVDVLASKAAGSTSILALWSSTGNKDNIKFNPDKYFYKPQEFIDWLESQK